jgi:hypothetical protein
MGDELVLRGLATAPPAAGQRHHRHRRQSMGARRPDPVVEIGDSVSDPPASPTGWTKPSSNVSELFSQSRPDQLHPCPPPTTRLGLTNRGADRRIPGRQQQLVALRSDSSSGSASRMTIARPGADGPARRSSHSAGSSRPGWRGRAGSGVAGSSSGRARRRTGSPGRSSRWPWGTVRPLASRRRSLEGSLTAPGPGPRAPAMSRRPTADRPTTDKIGAVVPSNRALTYLDPPSGDTVSTEAGQGQTPTLIKKGTTIMTKTTDEVIDRFNQAFQERDATLLEDMIAPDCVMERVQPAPDGTRSEGYDASFSSWKGLIKDTPATSRSRTSTPARSGRSSAGGTSGAPAPTTRSVASTSWGSSTARSSKPPAPQRPRRSSPP